MKRHLLVSLAANRLLIRRGRISRIVARAEGRERLLRGRAFGLARFAAARHRETGEDEKSEENLGHES